MTRVLVLALLVVGAAGCPRHAVAPADAGLADAGEALLDTECDLENPCPDDACVRGVCNSFGRHCIGSTDCGKHFACENGFCVAPQCDLPCCSFFDCPAEQNCVDFACTPLPCDGSIESCDVIVGLQQIACEESPNECAGASVCIDFEPPIARICATVAGHECELGGDEAEPFFADDGNAVPICVHRGTCVDGACQ